MIVKFKKIETLFKIIGMANPLINSGDAVSVVYERKDVINAPADKQSQLCCIGSYRQPLAGKDSVADTKTLWEL